MDWTTIALIVAVIIVGAGGLRYEAREKKDHPDTEAAPVGGLVTVLFRFQLSLRLIRLDFVNPAWVRILGRLRVPQF